MELREYQKVIAEEIDKRFKGINREKRRFVGVKLPTGGGKSFLFMDQLIKFFKEYNEENLPKEDCISEVPIRYYAPLLDIIIQTETIVAKYIILEYYIDKFKNDNQISDMNLEDVREAVDVFSERMLNKAGKKGRNRKENKQKIEAAYSKRIEEKKEPEEILRSILEDSLRILLKDISKIVRSEFTNLGFICYQKKEDIDDNLEDEIRLMVLDEVQRLGKDVWAKRIANKIRKNAKCKVLAITATDKRDVDGKEPMEELADLSGYSMKELRERDYLASDMSLVHALENGLVVKPRVISFDCKLDDTYEYEEVVKILNKAEESLERVNQKIIDKQRKNPSVGHSRTSIEKYHRYNKLLFNFCKMNKLCGKTEFIKEHLSDSNPKDKELMEFLNKSQFTPNYIILEYLKEKIYEIDDVNTEIHREYDEWKEKKVAEIVKETIENTVDSKQKKYLKHGKGICFTPRSKDKKQTKDIMNQNVNMMKRYFGLSDEDVMITHSNNSVISRKDDEENLRKFILGKDENDPIQIMVAMDKFNEGLHVDGVILEFMVRQFGKNSFRKI